MNKIHFDLVNFEEVEIVPLADLHIGNPLCDEVALKNAVDYILEEPENPKRARICLLNGDLTESVTKSSKGNIFDMVYSPQTQIAMVVKYLLPLTQTSEKYPQGKILSYCSGNHDNGRFNDTGVTASETIAVHLGLQERYSNDGCYSFVKLSRVDYAKETILTTIYNQHMTGGGSTIGAKANRVVRAGLGGGIIADVVVGSHVHQPMTFKEDVVMPYKSALVQKTITYVVTNAFLKFGDYSQRMGMKPATISIPRIIIKQARDKSTNRYSYVEVIL